MKKQYEYKVGNFSVGTRESARMIQRSLRAGILNNADIAEQIAPVPRIIQKLTVERVVR